MSDGITPLSEHESAPSVVVAIGASAGGLTPTMGLLRALGARPGLALVIVHHLDPHQESMLVEVLARATEMPVDLARDGTRLERDHVYVIPPNADLRVRAGLLRVGERTLKAGIHRPVDELFQSVAEDCGARGVGVVLSGTGTDGSRGVEAIKAGGGLTFAQDPSAQHAGMPDSAIASGCVDAVLSPAAIAAELLRVAERAPVGDGGEGAPDRDAFRRIVRSMDRATQIDFGNYRESTIRRRIARRMFLHRLADVAAYADLLDRDATERDALAEDVLIHVTSFFRDPDVFEALSKQVFPKLAPPGASAPIRVWVPGCSTGEEAYSLAIALVEYLEDVGAKSPIKLFGTDVSRRAIDRARAGTYPPGVAEELSAGRLQRFFVRTTTGYQIAGELRDRCIFATQDATRDPPLSKVSLISCRNVMICLGPALQQRLLPAFHFALLDDGFLVLGTSETVGPFPGFASIDAKHKIFARAQAGPRGDSDVADSARWMTSSRSSARLLAHGGDSHPDVRSEADRAVLGVVAPPAVVVSDDLAIVEFRGQTGAYLEPAAGIASLGLLRMAREELRVPLHKAIEDARATGKPASRPGVLVGAAEALRKVDLLVVPFLVGPGHRRFFVVLFTPVGAVETAASPPSASTVEEQLRGELAAAREYLQSVIDQLQVGNEELRAANEEGLSSNEELQSTNEELQTAKEELQATNEELRTVNDEMAERNQEAARVNDDLTNVLSSVAIPILILGHDSRIRRFTPAAGQILRLIAADVGRPLADISPRVRMPELPTLISEVLERRTPMSHTVQRDDGRWCEVSVRPYRTRDDRVDGTVITLFDIDERKTAEAMLAAARDYAESVVDTVRDGLIVLDGELRVRSASRPYCETFGERRDELEGKSIYAIAGGAWDVPALRAWLAQMSIDGARFDEVRIDRQLPGQGRRVVVLSGRRIAGAPWTVLAFADVTARALADDAIRKSEAGFRRMLAAAAEPILMSDVAGTIVFANDAAVTTFGYDAGEIVGLPMDALVPAALRGVHESDRAGFLASPAARRLGRDDETLFARRKDGSDLPVEVVLSPMDGVDGPVVVAFVTDVSARKENERRIREYQEQLQRIAFEATVAEERERRRIAMGLHDRIGQALAVAQMKLTVAREATGGDARTSVEAALALISESIGDVRSLTFDLSPPVLYDLGLRAALSWLSEELEKRNGVSVSFTDDGFDPSLDDATAAILFRSVRELLMNVIKHAHASSARLTLHRVGDDLEVRVEDDGVGFDPASARQGSDGFGLFSVKEQLTRLGGGFEVFSSAGSGTRVLLRLPLAMKPS